MSTINIESKSATVSSSKASLSKTSQSEDNLTESGNSCIDFHGAAIIDENGQEIAITEAMIKTACNKLIEEQSPTTHYL